jgi:hypothetical protein
MRHYLIQIQFGRPVLHGPFETQDEAFEKALDVYGEPGGAYRRLGDLIGMDVDTDGTAQVWAYEPYILEDVIAHERRHAD